MAGTDRVPPQPPPHPPQRGSLGRRLRDTRARRFVGRDEEIAQLSEALSGSPGAPKVLLVHGPGGIGKSTLLDRMAHESAEADRSVVRIDAGRAPGVTPTHVEPAPELRSTSSESVLQSARDALAEAAGAVPHRPQVLLVDSVDRCGGLEMLLRHELLPDLPDDVVVVIASRRPPQQEWTTDPGWREVVDVLRLKPLPEGQSVELLTQRGVPTRLVPSVLRFAAGNPLALSLAADDVDAADLTWEAGPELTKVVLGAMVDPHVHLEHAVTLAICSLVRHTTIELLRTVLDADEAASEFTWLSTLPGVRVEPWGLRLDDLTHRLFDAVHRWSDPAGHEELRRIISAFQVERVCAGGPQLPQALRELAQLSGLLDGGSTAPRTVELDLGPDLAAAVLALSEATLGASCRPQVEYWLARQPEAFTVYGSPGSHEPVSFMAWLRLAPPTPDDLTADPVVAAVWAHVERTGPLSPGEEIGVVRFIDSLAPAPALGVTDPRLVRWHAEIVRASPHLAATFVALPSTTTWTTCMTGLDHHRVADPAVPGPASGSVVFEHDWRDVPLAAYLERVFPATGRPAAAVPPGRGAEPAREEFDGALRQLLRQWHDDDAVAANLLTRSGLGADLPADGDPIGRIRQIVKTAILAMQDDPRQVKYFRALAATYVQGSLTQEAAAARLGVPFGTFRRHLGKGTALLSDQLWRQLRRPPTVHHESGPLEGSQPPEGVAPVAHLDLGIAAIAGDHGLEPA